MLVFLWFIKNMWFLWKGEDLPEAKRKPFLAFGIFYIAWFLSVVFIGMRSHK